MQSDRLKLVQDHLNTLNSLCSVLGMDYHRTISEVHPSFVESEGARSISNDTIERLAIAIKNLREVKVQRMQKVNDIANY